MTDTFDILAKDYRPMVRTYLHGLLQDAHLAEDLTQETFLTAHKSIDKFDTDQDFGAWLRGIARNKVMHHRRAAARRPLVVDSRVIEGMEEVFQQFDSSAGRSGPWLDRLHAVRACINKLSDNLRAAMEHVYLKGMSLKEAAEQLSISSEAVGQRVSRARNLVRNCVSSGKGGDQ